MLTHFASQSTCQHVAIIMDGNGRWADERGLPRLTGHREGAVAVNRTTEAAARLGLPMLTLYAFSSDNWRRPEDEVSGLFSLFAAYLRDERARATREGIRVSVVGRRDRLAPRLVREIERTEEATRPGTRLHLRIAIDYSSRDLLVSAASQAPRSREEMARAIGLAMHADGPSPDVDLLIRTGRERRLSDFLLWECAYAELVFVDRMWPEFSEDDLAEALHAFELRQRRFGKTPAQAGGVAMNAQYDVVVIGAGLAGLWCARELSRAGLRVAVADRKHDPGEKVHTTGIFVRKTFEETGLPHAFLGAPISRVRLHGPRGATLALTSDRDEFRIGRMPELYRHLLAQAIDHGVDWLPGMTFSGTRAIDDGSAVSLSADGATIELLTRFVVGADGARSRVARDLRLDVNDRFLVGAEHVFHRAADASSAELECHLDPELAPGYIAWAASDADELHVGVAGEPGRFDPASALNRFVERVSPRLGITADAPSTRRGGLIPVNGVLRRIASSRGLLIGDAAGAVSPLTAGGLDACIRLSSAAARLIVEAVNRRDSSILTQFDGARFRTRFVSRLWMRNAMSAITSPLLLDTAIRLAALPPLSAFARQIFFGRGSFPDVKFEFETARSLA